MPAGEEKPVDEAAQEFPVDPDAIESISSIETARLGLHWALKKLRETEAAKAALAARLSEEERLRVRAAEEARDLQRALSERVHAEQGREVYNRKLEELLSQRLAGQLDLKRLLDRETELAQLQAVLTERQAGLEREFSARREGMELEYSRLAQDLRTQAQEERRREEEALAQRQAAMDKDLAAKAVAVREAEIRVAHQEKALSERQARVDEYQNAQRVRLDADLANLREEAKLQSAVRLREAERLFEERHAAIEDRWREERTLLMQELAQLRSSAKEQSRLLLELERKAAQLELDSARSRDAAQRRVSELELDRSEERSAAERKIDALRQRLSEAEAGALELEKAKTLAQEEAARLSSALSLERERQARSERLWAQEKTAAAMARTDSDARLAELTARLVEAEKRAGSLSEELRQSQLSASRAAQVLEEAHRARQGDREAFVLELERRDARFNELLSRYREFDLRLSAAETAAQRESLRAQEKEQAQRITELEKSIALTQELRRQAVDALAEAVTERERTAEKLAELKPPASANPFPAPAPIPSKPPSSNDPPIS